MVESDVDQVRRAVAGMRRLALAADDDSGRWEVDRVSEKEAVVVNGTGEGDVSGEIDWETAAHMAAWDPEMALAVADLLENHVDAVESIIEQMSPGWADPPVNDKFMVLARRFLREEA